MEHKIGGISLKNSLVASSSPLTESAERLMCCETAGFGAAILKSSADYDKTGAGYTRKIVYTDGGYYADGSFEHEILTLPEGLALYENGKKVLNGDMLLIPSISADSLAPEKWIKGCKAFSDQGARVLQLDFFYLSTMEHNEDFWKDFVHLFTALKENVNSELMPKINLKFEAAKTFDMFSKAGIRWVSLLDSMREDAPDSFQLHSGATSFFGHKQLPYTIFYLKEAKKYGLMVCAGGGITSAEDANILRSFGADLIQTASYVLMRGFSSVADLLDEGHRGKSERIRHGTWCDSKDFSDCVSCGGCNGAFPFLYDQ